jgi:hypothetical protein
MNDRELEEAGMELISESELTLYFSDLCVLREEGTMNMIHAPQWLRDNYCFSRAEAKYVFKEWVKSLSPYPVNKPKE